MNNIVKCSHCNKAQIIIKGQVECIFCHQLLKEKQVEFPTWFNDIFNN